MTSVEQQVQAVANYWDGHPGAAPANAGPAAQAAYNAELAAWENKFGADGPPPPPEPPTIPGPPVPGAGMPAARISDLHAHGGVMLGPGCPKVLIGGLPAIRVSDQAVCPVLDGLIPHVSGMVLTGSNKVLIAGLPAARVSDPIGPPGNCKGNAIAMGCTKVLIGESVGAAGGGPAGGAASPGSGATAECDRPTDESAHHDTVTPNGGHSDPAERPSGPSSVEAGKGTHWIAIELVDERESPVPGEPFEIILPDRSVVRSSLDARGTSRITGIEQPGWCQVSFIKLDLTAWERWNPGTGERPTSPVGPTPASSPLGTIPNRDGAHGRGNWRRVNRGDCLSSIADETGHAINTIWNHDQNSLLRHRRVDPNVLQVGDAVFVPVVRRRTEQASTDRSEKFRRIGTTTSLRIKLFDHADPPAAIAYTLNVDGKITEGTTSRDGLLEVPIPARARRATLHAAGAEHRLDLGALNPISDVAGVQQRLNNLGFQCGRPDGEWNRPTLAALNLFRLRLGMQVSAEPDQETARQLVRHHDEMRPLPPEPADESDDDLSEAVIEEDPEFDASEEVL